MLPWAILPALSGRAMTLPSQRDMPVVEAEWLPEGLVVYLPGNRERRADDVEHARAIVAREAPGSALRILGRATKEQARR